jgi:HEAT repeat protein
MKSSKYVVVGCSMLLAALGVLNCVMAEDEPQVGDKPLSELLKQLRSENRGLQMRAAQALSAAPTNLHERIMPQVIPVLRSERENDKFVAAQVMGAYGPGSRRAIPDLLPMLQGTQYERNRAAAAKALGQILKDAKADDEVEKVTQALIKAFGDGYIDVRREAVSACGMIGPAAKACIPHLKDRLTDGATGDTSAFVMCRPVRSAAAKTCGQMGPLAAEHIDLLISWMHKEGAYCQAFAEAIGLIGPVNESVIPNIIDELENATSDGNWWWYRKTLIEALGHLGEKSLPALPLIKRLLPSRDALAVKIAMVKFVGGFGEKARDLAPNILGQISFADGQLAENPKNEEAKTLKEEAVKAYKAVTGQEPPAAAKK